MAPSRVLKAPLWKNDFLRAASIKDCMLKLASLSFPPMHPVLPPEFEQPPFRAAAPFETPSPGSCGKTTGCTVWLRPCVLVGMRHAVGLPFISAHLSMSTSCFDVKFRPGKGADGSFTFGACVSPVASFAPA